MHIFNWMIEQHIPPDLPGTITNLTKEMKGKNYVGGNVGKPAVRLI